MGKFWYNYKKQSLGPDLSRAEGPQNGANYAIQRKRGAMKVRDNYPQGDTAQLTQGLREQLREMEAASQALGSGLAGNEKAEQYLAVLDRAICAQLRLAQRKVRANYPSDTLRLAQGLRKRLQEMAAATQVLGARLAGDETAQEHLAVLDRAICAQLRLVRHAELGVRLYTPDEVRIFPAPVDLVELCRATAEKADALTRPFLGIKTEFSSALAALPALADRDALQQMLLLFITNSVRAIGNAGSVRLELKRAEDWAVLTLTDTGCGLDPEAMADLFDPQEEPGSRARGLPLARQIVKLHGGTLVASSAESGTRVAVSIPIVERKGGSLHSPWPQVDTGGGWDPALVELSVCLPAPAFLPGRRT